MTDASRISNEPASARPFPKIWETLATIAVSAVVLLSFIMVAAASWILANFGPVAFDQAMMNLPGAGGEGEAFDAPLSFVTSFVGLAIAGPLVVAILVVIPFIVVKRHYQGQPAKYRHIWAAMVSFTAVAGALGAISLDNALGIRQWMITRNSDLTIADYNVVPEVTKALPGDLNLVVIYMESLDDAFGDNTLVETNALKDLQEATEDWYQMDRLLQYNGGGWTMGGLVSTQCALPARPSGGRLPDEFMGLEEESFMPGAVCLGDLLKDAGYTGVFLSGADSNYASKGKFLRSHGIDTVVDANDWKKMGETEFSQWGLSDRRLFEQAKDQVLSLHQNSQPFFLSLLTVDNHTPVEKFPYCPEELTDETLNAIQCQSRIVGDYINFMADEGILDDTVVVVMADHRLQAGYALTKYREKTDYDHDRAPLFQRFYSPKPFEFARNDDTQMHMFPTIFELLGGELKDGRAGMGVSLMVPAYNVQGVSVLDLSWEESGALYTSPSAAFWDEIWQVPPGESLETPQSR